MEISPPGLCKLSQAAAITTKALICGTCAFWQPRNRAHDYCAPCGMGYGAPPFDHTCAYHSERDAVPAELSQQSQTRGMTMQDWQRKLTPKA